MHSYSFKMLWSALGWALHFYTVRQRQKLPIPSPLFQMLQVFHLFPSFAFVISLEQSIILPDYIYIIFILFSLCIFVCFIAILTGVYCIFYGICTLWPFQNPKLSFTFWNSSVAKQFNKQCETELNTAKLWNFVGFYIRNQVAPWLPTQRAYVSKLFKMLSQYWLSPCFPSQ